MELVHLSDLHVGSPDFRPELLENVVEHVNERKPDLVVFTGDATDDGALPNFVAAKRYFDGVRVDVPVAFVPGNHDARNNGLVFFETTFGPRFSHREFEEHEAALWCLSSPMSDLRDGYLGGYQVRWLVRTLAKTRANLKILALHHHLVPVPDAGRNRDTTWDAGDILAICQWFDVDLVLMGHRHVPHAYSLGRTTLVYACTGATIKLRGEEDPSFNVIRVDGDVLEVHIVSSVTLESELLIRREGDQVTHLKRRATRVGSML
ncbi:MAG: metallophosphoesterase [Promethearchaeota archaeon]